MCYNIRVTPGWCNGNTGASGALILGSNPSPGKFKPRFWRGFIFASCLFAKSSQVTGKFKFVSFPDQRSLLLPVPQRLFQCLERRAVPLAFWQGLIE